jgi:hypothetical protein
MGLFIPLGFTKFSRDFASSKRLGSMSRKPL